MAASNEILKEVLNLAPTEMAELSDKLLSSLYKQAKEFDELWAREAEDRIEAYEQGKLGLSL